MRKLVADTYGHCILCHENMIYDQVIDSKVEKRFSPLYDEVTYLLDDGSSMRVAICKKCQPKMEDTGKEKKYIMDCVKEGWKVETSKLVADESKPDWTVEKRANYLSRYMNRHLVMKADGVAKDVLKKKLNKFKEGKNGSNN